MLGQSAVEIQQDCNKFETTYLFHFLNTTFGHSREKENEYCFRNRMSAIPDATSFSF